MDFAVNVRLLFSAILAIAFVALLGPSSVSAAAPVVVYGDVDATPSWHVPGVACGDAGAVDTVVGAPSGHDDRPANEGQSAPFGDPTDDSGDDDEATDCLGPVAFTYIPSSVITAAAPPPHRCTSVIRKSRGYADGMEHPPRS
jgi:hypothetical protein